MFTIVYILIGAGVFVVLAAELAVGVIKLRNVQLGDQAERGEDCLERGKPWDDERSSTTTRVVLMVRASAVSR